METTFDAALSGFTFVVQLSIVCDPELGETNLVLQLSSDAELRRRRTFWFHGVASLRIGDVGGGPIQFCGLRVTDVAARQLDRLRYEVEDDEDGRIAFLCRDITCADE